MTAHAVTQRYIFNDADLEQFLVSPAKKQLLTLVEAMGKSCASSCFEYDPSAPLVGLSPAVACLHGSLKGMESWLSDFPPIDRSQARFGNPSFRSWHKRLRDRAVAIVSAVLKARKDFPEQKDYDATVLEDMWKSGIGAAGLSMPLDSVKDEQDRRVVSELTAYLDASFGHPTRLDFGTGHESSFQVFLYSLCKLGCFGSTAEEPPTRDRLKAVTLSIWHQYLRVTRQVQTEYMLEPAGSHGVWGLDDYHCLPFYYGACQMEIDGEEYSPSSIHKDSLLKQHSDKFLYFSCIKYIKSLKVGVPFFEHSPMLNDISQLPSWHKVSVGLLRLYEGEVLKKRQVVQHFVFGDVFSANWTPSEHEKEPPTENFRTPGANLPETRAPWATGDATGPPTARAPWAK